MEKEKSSRFSWLVLIGIIIVRGFATGLNTISSLFLAPVSEDLGTGIGTLSIYFSIFATVQILWFGYAGKLLNRYDVRWVTAVSVCLQAVSFAAFGWMKHVTGWYVLAIPLAMGAAILVYLLGPVLVNRWFDKNTGSILGIQSAFVGLLGAVLQPMTSNMIEIKGWRAAYFSMGLLALCVMLLATAFFIRDKSGNVSVGKESRLKSMQIENVSMNNGLRTEGEEDINVEEAGFQKRMVQDSTHKTICLPALYALTIFLFAVTGVAVFVQHIPTYGILMGYSMSNIGMVLSLASIGNAIGAFLIGFLSDRIGGLKTCYLILGVWLAAIVGFLFGGSHFVIFAIAAVLNGLVTPSVMVSAPILTLLLFGKENYEKIYAKVSMGAPLASIFLIPMYGFIYDVTESYLLVLLILIILLVLAGISIAYGWKVKRIHEC